jgi:hypothetical protein
MLEWLTPLDDVERRSFNVADVANETSKWPVDIPCCTFFLNKSIVRGTLVKSDDLTFTSQRDSLSEIYATGISLSNSRPYSQPLDDRHGKSAFQLSKTIDLWRHQVGMLVLQSQLNTNTFFEKILSVPRSSTNGVIHHWWRAVHEVKTDCLRNLPPRTWKTSLIPGRKWSCENGNLFLCILSKFYFQSIPGYKDIDQISWSSSGIRIQRQVVQSPMTRQSKVVPMTQSSSEISRNAPDGEPV